MITFEEIKEIFKKSIDATDTMNQAIENFIRSIYLKGYNDAQRKSCKDEDIAKAFQLGLAFGFGEQHDEMDKVIDEIKESIIAQSSDTCTDLCKSCETKGCIFQSGIKREKCNFYTSEKKHRKEDEK